jgi:hypothetical protein
MTQDFMASISSNSSDATRFFDTWFSQVPLESLISVIRIDPTRPGAKPLIVTIQQVKDAIEDSGLDELIWSDGTLYDLYYSAVTLHRPEKGRGGLRHVNQVPGVWLDIDVKPSGFDSEAQVLELLTQAPLRPTAVVLTGSGGVHAYWRLRKPVDSDTGRELNLRWWSLMSDLAYPAKIDRLVDPSRVLRIPGAIRWPKKPGEQPAQVRLHDVQDFSYTKKEILDWTEEVWAEHQARIARTKERIFRSRAEAEALLLEQVEETDNPWLRYIQIAGMEDMFNDRYSWDSILMPKGWTKLGLDDENRVLWARPGGDWRKSATTDWPESPDVMSLFSTAEETGLLGLLDAGIVLTKYRVWVELYCGGDEKVAIETLMKEL